MTCIVGLVHNDKVYMGGDSAAVGGLSIVTRGDTKVFKVGEFIFGFTSSFRMGQLLQYNFVAPPVVYDTDIHRYMVTDFIDAIRDTFKNGGFAAKEAEREIGGVFLVGYKNNLFRIDSDYQVGFNRNGYEAVGCGEDIARGSLFSTKNWDHPRERVLEALEAAESHSAGVRGPFNIVTT